MVTYYCCALCFHLRPEHAFVSLVLLCSAMLHGCCSESRRLPLLPPMLSSWQRVKNCEERALSSLCSSGVLNVGECVLCFWGTECVLFRTERSGGIKAIKDDNFCFSLLPSLPSFPSSDCLSPLENSCQVSTMYQRKGDTFSPVFNVGRKRARPSPKPIASNLTDQPPLQNLFSPSYSEV